MKCYQCSKPLGTFTQSFQIEIKDHVKETFCFECAKDVNQKKREKAEAERLNNEKRKIEEAKTSPQENETPPKTVGGNNTLITGEGVITDAQSMYRTGKSIAGFVFFFGWVIVILGALAFLGNLLDDAPTMKLILCLALVMSGLFHVMGAQVMKSSMDTADFARGILEHLKKHKS